MSRYFKQYNGQWLQVDYSQIGESESLVLIFTNDVVYLIYTCNHYTWNLCTKRINGFIKYAPVPYIEEVHKYYTSDDCEEFKKLLKQIEVQYG